VHLAKKAGFENIGIDLIYGIPGQSMESWRRTLDAAVSLEPEHISTYELTVEKGTLLYEFFKNPPSSPFYKVGIIESPLKQRGVRGDFINKTHLPEEDKIIEMYNHAIDHLSSSGFEHYEISNFAKPGCQSRHNLNYWDRGDYFGAGLGAHSFINGVRYSNTDELDNYIELLAGNHSPSAGLEVISYDKAVAEAIFLGLRKVEGINIKSFFKRYGLNILSRYQAELADMEKSGLLEITNAGTSISHDGYPSPIPLPQGEGAKGRVFQKHEASLRLTRRGLLLSNEVFVKLS
ncbi:MAG: hypothetical protein HY809_06020, partial [Nitrospirae bacterium]|nr:hypothetical protein [Nitrospirota bacterium]